MADMTGFPEQNMPEKRTFVRPFRAWFQKTLPAVYDDSLSYVEMLSKVVDALNSVISTTNGIVNDFNELINYYEQLYEWVKNYFENLDIQEEINKKLDEMAQDGTFEKLFGSFVLLNDQTPPYRIMENITKIGKLPGIPSTHVVGGMCFDDTYSYIFVAHRLNDTSELCISKFTITDLENIENIATLDITANVASSHMNDLAFLNGNVYIAQSYRHNDQQNRNITGLAVINAGTMEYRGFVELNEGYSGVTFMKYNNQPVLVLNRDSSLLVGYYQLYGNIWVLKNAQYANPNYLGYPQGVFATSSFVYSIYGKGTYGSIIANRTEDGKPFSTLIYGNFDSELEGADKISGGGDIYIVDIKGNLYTVDGSSVPNAAYQSTLYESLSYRGGCQGSMLVYNNQTLVLEYLKTLTEMTLPGKLVTNQNALNYVLTLIPVNDSSIMSGQIFSAQFSNCRGMRTAIVTGQFVNDPIKSFKITMTNTGSDEYGNTFIKLLEVLDPETGAVTNITDYNSFKTAVNTILGVDYDWIPNVMTVDNQFEAIDATLFMKETE